jgi:acyl carrier protein
MDERKTKIKGFLSKYFRNHELKDDEDIFALGFVNSLLAIVAFVEKEFGIEVGDEDLDIANFRSVDKIDELVGRKLAPASA